MKNLSHSQLRIWKPEIRKLHRTSIMVHAKVKPGFVAHPASILVRWFKLSLNLLLYPAKIVGIKQAETQQFGE